MNHKSCASNHLQQEQTQIQHYNRVWYEHQKGGYAIAAKDVAFARTKNYTVN